MSDKFHSSLLCVGDDKSLIDCVYNKVSFLSQVKKSWTEREGPETKEEGSYPVQN